MPTKTEWGKRSKMNRSSSSRVVRRKTNRKGRKSANRKGRKSANRVRKYSGGAKHYMVGAEAQYTLNEIRSAVQNIDQLLAVANSDSILDSAKPLLVNIIGKVKKELHYLSQRAEKWEEANREEAPPPMSFKEKKALENYPSSATPSSASVTVGGDYKKDWKKTSFYNDLFPHTEHVQRHVIFKKGERSGDFVVTQDSQNSDPENTQAEGYYHYITHTPSGKTYWDTRRFFA